MAISPSAEMVTTPMLASFVPVEVMGLSPAASLTSSRVEWEWPSMKRSMPSTASIRSMERLPLDSSSMPRWPRHTM